MNNASQLIGRTIEALDGEIGSVEDLYFDDQTWNVRYLVVETGKWLTGRSVLMVPEAIVTPWHHQAAIAVKLTKEQIQSSPGIDVAMPVSRSAEELLHRHYRWTPYWDSTIDWDSTIAPVPEMPPLQPALTDEAGRQQAGGTVEAPAGVELRSANELGGYHIEANDGEVGEVEDLVIDDNVSRILFLVVKVKGWLSSKKVLAGPSLISGVDGSTSTIHVDANRQGLKNAKEYNPAA